MCFIWVLFIFIFNLPNREVITGVFVYFDDRWTSFIHLGECIKNQFLYSWFHLLKIVTTITLRRWNNRHDMIILCAMPLIWCSISKPIIFHSKATLDCSLNFGFFGLEYHSMKVKRRTKSLTLDMNWAMPFEQVAKGGVRDSISYTFQYWITVIVFFLALWIELRVCFLNGWRDWKNQHKNCFLKVMLLLDSFNRRGWTRRDDAYTVITEFYWLKNNVGSCSVPSTSSKREKKKLTKNPIQNILYLNDIYTSLLLVR